QPGNRNHIFNLAYSVEVGDHVKGNKLAGGFVNGWQVSGILQLQSGANLSGIQATNGSGNFVVNTNGAKIPGTDYNISSVSLLGTPDIELNPILTCDPSSGLGKNQYINPNCFALPTKVGQNGPTVLPAIYGPSYFNWDMGLFKNFQVT